MDSAARPPTADSFAWGRSLLFCPGNRRERFAKAVTSGADTVVLDLEDSVDPTDKPAARLAVADYLAREGSTPVGPTATVTVRCNAVGSDDFERDMEALAGSLVAALVVPKVTNWGQTQTILRERFAGRPMPALCATVETARGVIELPALVAGNQLFSALSWGPYDLAADLGVRHARSSDGSLAEPIAHARSQILTAAAAGGLMPLDTVTVRYDDLDVVAGETREAAELGFVGKFAIHPSQIETIHRCLRPDPQDVIRAQEILAVAEHNGAGAASLDGHMLDEALYRNARNTLAAAGQPTKAPSKPRRNNNGNR